MGQQDPVPGQGPVYAVTTRSRLRSASLYPSMWLATAAVKRQLRRTSGCFRFASIPTTRQVFWSLSLWRSREEMLSFMQSGAHERFLWRYADWFDSFWLMRWRPTSDELGKWSRLSASSGLPREAIPPMKDHRLAAAFGAVPDLLEAAVEGGAPSHVSAPTGRRARRRVEGGEAVTIRVSTDRLSRRTRAIRQLRELCKEVDEWGGRSAVGAAAWGELFAIAVSPRPGIWDTIRTSAALGELSTTTSMWAMRWQAESEFGHWDGWRLRKQRRMSADVAGEGGELDEPW